jgi:hypothetical protein
MTANEVTGSLLSGGFCNADVGRPASKVLSFSVTLKRMLESEGGFGRLSEVVSSVAVSDSIGETGRSDEPVPLAS